MLPGGDAFARGSAQRVYLVDGGLLDGAVQDASERVKDAVEVFLCNVLRDLDPGEIEKEHEV
jgi:hypothetical protein